MVPWNLCYIRPDIKKDLALLRYIYREDYKELWPNLSYKAKDTNKYRRVTSV